MEEAGHAVARFIVVAAELAVSFDPFVDPANLLLCPNCGGGSNDGLR